MKPIKKTDKQLAARIKAWDGKTESGANGCKMHKPGSRKKVC